jgi:protein O-GlcNAc transferase
MNAGPDILLRAIELQNQGQAQAAAALFEQLLAMEPGNAAALYSLGVIRHHQQRHAEALALVERGIAAAPTFPPMWFGYGSVLQALGRWDEALRAYDRALEIKPDYLEVLINSGALLRKMLRHHEALVRFNQAVSVDPRHEPALGNCAILLSEFKQHEQSVALFERLLEVNPAYDYGLGLLLYERLHFGDWTGFEDLRRQILDGVAEGRRACKSLAFMALSDSASQHFLCARIFAHHFCPAPAREPLWRGERYPHRRIRLAYVSPDLREHPVGHLMAGIFERHDKSRFETIAISLGHDDGSRLRARMLGCFDHFLDCGQMESQEIARRMRELEVDIAVDLAGYTSDARIDLFAYRPAPVQVNFLGYPGTLAVSYMDYILADRWVVPPEHQPFYSEKVAYLPDCYLPPAADVEIAEPGPSRAECGLPETGLVLCSFSHDYKITPPLWATWMRILQRLPGSVLWLVSRNAHTQQNFREAAKAAGVDPERLVFAGRVPKIEDHLARYRLADLFLDTWPYNAHTTAADALLAGLPVVTYMGRSFPSRVAGSLLHAAGLPELITDSLEGYESLVLELAQAPERLAGLKRKLRAGRATSPLFDQERFCRNLEAAYADLYGSLAPHPA